MKITCIMVSTVDGVIAKNSGHDVDWSSPEDKKMFRQATKNIGVVIVGSETYKTMGKHMPKRLNIVMTSTPEKYKDKEIPGELEFIKGTPEEIIQMLESRDFGHAALIGGAKLNAGFLKENLVNELFLTIEPKIFGQGLRLSEGVDLDIDMELVETKKLNENTVWLKYNII